MLFRHDKLRSEQKLLYDDIYDCISNASCGFFEAPTGLGKTDASISAALTYAIQNRKKVVFVTPKNSQHKVAVDVIKGINKKYDLKLKGIDFVSKANMCVDPFIHGLGSEFYDLCDRKVEKGACIAYNNTIGKTKDQKVLALSNVLNYSTKNHDLSYEEMREASLDNPVLCPYELSLLISKEANLIICDVNHLFIEKIRQKMLTKMGAELNDLILIFDEAHNLPGRIRSIGSSQLSERTISSAISELERMPKDRYFSEFTTFMSIFNDLMRDAKEGYVDYNFFDDLFKDYNFDMIIETMNDIVEYQMERTEKRSSYAAISNFLLNWFSSKDAARYFDSNKVLQLKSLDPSKASFDVISESFSSIFMSATLRPTNMYSSMLGAGRTCVSKSYLSPFSKHNRLVMIDSSVTTKFDKRKESIPKIAKTITDIVNKTPGNIAVFFPSYDMLSTVHSLVSRNTLKKIFIQNPDSPHIESQKMIDNFKKMGSGIGSTLFAVIGGSFSEGVDFPGDELIGTIIVGIAFPEPDYEIKALIDYYDSKYSQGWNYAYLYPTMSKIVQAIGRSQRTESDKAFTVLMDDRYNQSKYKELFPKDYEFSPLDIDKISRFLKS